MAKLCPFRLETIYNVMDANGLPHGAHADDTTDDTPHFQAAIEACYAGGGGVVHVPAGHYYLITGSTINADCYAQIHLHDNVSLRGAGEGSTFIRSPYAETAKNTICASQQSDISVSYLTVSESGSDAIKMYACSRVHIDHVTMDYIHHTAVNMAGCSNSWVRNCTATNYLSMGIFSGENAIALQNPEGLWNYNVEIADCVANSSGVALGFGITGRNQVNANPRDADHSSILRCSATGNNDNFYLAAAINATVTDCTSTNPGTFHAYTRGAHTCTISGMTYNGTAPGPGGGTWRIMHETSNTPPWYAEGGSMWTNHGVSTGISIEGTVYNGDE